MSITRSLSLDGEVGQITVSVIVSGETPANIAQIIDRALALVNTGAVLLPAELRLIRPEETIPGATTVTQHASVDIDGMQIRIEIIAALNYELDALDHDRAAALIKVLPSTFINVITMSICSDQMGDAENVIKSIIDTRHLRHLIGGKIGTIGDLGFLSDLGIDLNGIDLDGIGGIIIGGNLGDHFGHLGHPRHHMGGSRFEHTAASQHSHTG